MGRAMARTLPIKVSVPDNPTMTLAEWQRFIQDLIDLFGESSILGADAGYNNVSMEITVRKGSPKVSTKEGS
jgi:hypothetical protein